MDGDRFDALARALAAPGGSRRRLLGGLAAAAAALLGGLGPEDAAAHNALKKCKKIEDRKKRAACIKKAKAHAETHADAAPPCTADGCPLPPGCSQGAVDACASALHDRVAAEAEPCRAECEADPRSAACQWCLAPILKAALPGAEACVAEACAAPAAAGAAADGDVRAADLWYHRKCPGTCCYADDRECREGMRDAFLACLGGAVAAAYKSGGTALLPGIAACTGKITYDHYRCVAKVGCQEEGHVCVADGYCCPVAQACGTPHPNSCCGSGATCCGGKDCCPTGVGFTCLNEGAGPCCYGGQTVCGGKCCATDRCHECRNGSCVDLCDGLNQYCGAGNVCKECDPRTGCGG